MPVADFRERTRQFHRRPDGVAADTEEINPRADPAARAENATANRIEETRQRADDLVSQLKGGATSRGSPQFLECVGSASGGALGWRNTDRLPALFIDAVKNVKVGDIAPVVRSPNGFHILKVSGAAAPSKASSPAAVQQTRARHILLRVSMWHRARGQRRLEEFRRASKTARSSSARLRACIRSTQWHPRGDLGWLYPGDTVPEFERAMNALKINEISIRCYRRSAGT